MNKIFRVKITMLAAALALLLAGQMQAQTVGGAVYGGGRKANVGGNAQVEVKATSTTGQDAGVGHVYGGNDIAGRVMGKTQVDLQGGLVRGNVFGGGNGDYGCANPSGRLYTSSDDTVDNVTGMLVPVAWKTEVNVAGTAEVRGSLYGGGNKANVGIKELCSTTGSDTATVDGTNLHASPWGAVDHISATINLVSGTIGTVYGGGRMAPIYGASRIVFPQNSVIHINQDIYAGNDIANTQAAASVSAGVVEIHGAPQIAGRVFGGGNGDYDYTSHPGEVWTLGDSSVRVATLCDQSSCTPAQLIEPRVLSGSVTLDMNPVAGADPGHVDTIYGGGNAAQVTDATTVTLRSGQVGSVFGGGCKADVQHTSLVSTAEDCHDLVVGNLFGGNDITGSVLGGTQVHIEGQPVIANLFGGGNGDYVYTSAPYAGLTAPDQENTTVLIEGNPRIATAYAGGNNATVTGTATLTMQGDVTGAGEGNPQVETLFGGNNLATMDIVPSLQLESGWVGTVYGGGNQGAMTASENIGDVRRVSTHVEVNSDDIHITEAIYGGCRAATVGTPTQGEVGEAGRIDGTGGTLVEVKRGTVKNIFGGNDEAEVCHYAHTYVTGGTVTGNIFGGSNGFYTPLPAGHTIRAAVDSSEVVIRSGEIGIADGSTYVYGGGWAGDGTYAYTLVDGQANLHSTLFGAGRGDVAKIGQCEPHLGNVKHAVTELKSVGEGSSATTVYGGGHSGDAELAELTLYPTFQHHLTTLYGGGYAGHITEGTITRIEGTPGVDQVDTVYGGNNFGGYVHKSELTVKRGRYNTIYGAGNGAYNYKTLLGTQPCYDTVPYSGDIVMHLGDPASSASPNDDLTVRGNVYGGGNLGVVRKFDLNNLASNITNATDVQPEGYGSIVMNVYNGLYKNHIFGGARGRALNDTRWASKRTYGRHHLAFAYKQVNMYNGHIEHSLYGGSEAVDDGYPWEFFAHMGTIDGRDSVATATLRPTGVVNLMGGRVGKNAYGGGYLGNIYGSVYFNIGRYAVDSCYVWTRNYATTTGQTVGFGRFKPALEAHDIYLQASVYNGSDWGEAGANAVFNTRGFYGGESHIFVDGKGYNTGLSTAGTNLPALDIFYSLIGSGTSTAEGDRGGRIIVRHYGEEGCPSGSKELYSIQRTGTVLLDSCFFLLRGEQDAYMSYASPDYSFNRIDTLIFRGHNAVTLQGPAVYIGDLRSEVKHRFFDPGSHPNRYETSRLVTAGEMSSHTVNCETHPDFCDQVTNGAKDNKLVMENGIYMSVLPYVEKYSGNRALGQNANRKYGPVEGYMFFLAAADNSRSYVYAREKNDTIGLDHSINMTDGGFLGICNTSNDFGSGSGGPNQYGDTVEYQLPYSNANKVVDTLEDPREENYRVWSVGDHDGKRSRAISIVANSDISATLCYNNAIPASGENNSNANMAVAHATLSLPPSASGNYYSVNSVVIDADNGGQVKLVRAAYDSLGIVTSGQWHYSGLTYPDDEEQQAVDRLNEVKKILNDPNYTFGLYFGLGENFGNNAPSAIDHHRVVDGTVVVGGSYFSAMEGLVTKEVALGNANGVIPTLEFELTYSRDFNSTIIRQITMEVMEYRDKDTTFHLPNGTDSTGYVREPVGPIDVTITIATVVGDFKDMDISLMAMYNEGVSNEYKRKVVLPATFQRRTIFLDGIEWYPDPEHTRDPDMATATNKFNMTSSRAGIPEQNNIFGVEVALTENVTDNIANTLGWYDITTKSFDVNDTARLDANGIPDRGLSHVLNHPFHSEGSTVHNDSSLGYQLGVLDGRATAALDFTLHYNGNLVYPEDDTLGFVVLHCHYTAGESERGDFDVRIRIKSRLHGDTIYLTSRKHGFYRGPIPEGQDTTPMANFVEGKDQSNKDFGKRPWQYVTNFETALDLYTEGDVIAIIDTVVLEGAKNLTINGADYWRLQVIRYSGSHDDAPGKSAAYRGPMIVLRDGASFTAYHSWFNGSGNTRVKRLPNDKDREVMTTIYDRDGYGTAYTLPDGVNRLPDTLWANSPIFTVEDNATLTFLRDVEVSNNYSALAERPEGATLGSHYTTTTTTTTTTNVSPNTGLVEPDSNWTVTYTMNDDASYLPGGAVGLYRTTDHYPTLRMGDGVRIHGNAILGDRDADHLNPNRGAAIYNEDGIIQLGMTQAGGDVVDITRNYTLPYDAIERGHAFVQTPTKVNWNSWVTTEQGGGYQIKYIDMPLFSLDTVMDNGTLNTIETFTSRYGERELVPAPIGGTLSNVFLTRTKAVRSGAKEVDTYDALHDQKSDLVTFYSPLGAKTRVGITKWFPGTNYPDREHLCRDTIMFSKLTNTRYLYAQENFKNRIFFDDSTTSYIFHHPTLSPLYIYFQRCASFKQRTTQAERELDSYVPTTGDVMLADDATKYKLNPDSKCSAVLDTLEYRVQGGFYPYTYRWQCAPVAGAGINDANQYVNGYTTSGNYQYASAIDWNDTLPGNSSKVQNIRRTLTPYDNKVANEDEVKRTLSSVDTCVTVNLVMVPTFPELNFVYRVEANDLTGNCPLPKEIDIRVVRTEGENYTAVEGARFLDKESINIENPGCDSNLAAHIGLDTDGTLAAPGDSTRTRYLRVCKGVHLGVGVLPSWDDGYVAFQAKYLQNDDLTLDVHDDNAYIVNSHTISEALKKQFFCPGDVLNLGTYKAVDNNGDTLTTSQFMMWDFDPQAPATDVMFTMPNHDYNIKAIYAPSQHWYEVVTSATGNFNVGGGVTQTPGYSVDYDGNVTISNEAGLAWLISTTNGLNYQQAHEFHNKRITILPKTDGTPYKMGAYLWTPLGTQNNPFNGRFDACDSVTNGNPISGIICLEPNLTYVGFFGNVGHDTFDQVVNPGNASIRNLRLDNLVIKGNNYVGGISAVVNDGTEVTHNTITNASMISGAYMVGGVAAQANGTVTISDNIIHDVDFLGNALYTGAIVAEDVEVPGNGISVMECNPTRTWSGPDNNGYYYSYSSSTGEFIQAGTYAGPMTIRVTHNAGNSPTHEDIIIAETQRVTIEDEYENPTVAYPTRIDITICTIHDNVGSQYFDNVVTAYTDKMTSSGVEGTVGAGTAGSASGQKKGFLRRLFGKPSPVPQAYIANNYVRLRTSGEALVAGGLMGQAQNANMVNNYVYGEVASQNNAGALLGYIGNNVSLDRCYYQDGTAVSAFGGGKQPKSGVGISSFTGSANQVRLAEKVHGIDNLTRALNSWALAQQYAEGSDINLWRSDLESRNNGLPLFGQPDMIKVVDTARLEVCDSYMWQGQEQMESGVFYVRVVDSARYLDSNAVYIFTLHHSQRDDYADSVEAGQGYQDHGFSLSGDELQQLRPEGSDPRMAYTIELIDSLLTAYGCDSVVVLSLTVYPKLGMDEPEVTLFEVEVYPNPTQGALTVESRHIQSIEVYDGISRQVLTRSGLDADRVQLDLSPYATGVYYLRITTAQGVAIKKVVKK